MSLALFKPKAEPGRIPADLSGRMVYLCGYGKPSLSRMDNGWHARIEMHVSSVGAQFTVKGDYNHDTPEMAVQVLLDRVTATLGKLGVQL
jgi:hypothetical protein